ncbi:hypothetical protein HY484_02810 [Candidatus Woesearchaeota archaeon]|nr:hypothetical protein [Candidatus Woesearchaeota archaeon]
MNQTTNISKRGKPVPKNKTKKKNKKGLELPITSIVIFIIAITFLGLALYFIKTTFLAGIEPVITEMEKIRTQLVKSMQESGETFAFNVADDLRVKRDTPFNFYIGVRNTAPSEKCYRLSIRCLRPFTPDGQGGKCSGTPPLNFVGGVDVYGTPVNSADNWFPTMLGEFSVRSNEMQIHPAVLQITGAQIDTYLMEAQLFEGDFQNGQCANFPLSQEEHKLTKRFHIILKQ